MDPDHIFLGVGSDEAIDLLIRVCCVPDYDSILITPPTYGMYSVCAHVNNVNVLEVPLTPEFHLQTSEASGRQLDLECAHSWVDAQANSLKSKPQTHLFVQSWQSDRDVAQPE